LAVGRREVGGWEGGRVDFWRDNHLTYTPW
jgi:hypothetical protein